MRTRTSVRLSPALALGAWVLLAPTHAVATPVFSIDQNSTGASDSDILQPGPIGGPPGVAVPDQNLGIQVAGTVDLDALTYGASAITLFFSVDRLSIGLGGTAVNLEAVAGQAAGDIYTGANALVFNQDILGLQPPIPAGALATPPIDNLDALDMSHPHPVPQPVAGSPPPVFSLLAGNVFGVSGADLLVAGPPTTGPPVVWVGFAALGLQAADDVDAVHFDPLTGLYYFSLAPGSPSLAAAACGGTSAADVFVSAAGGTCALFAPALALGLLATDNVDAIAFVPEPGALTLLLGGLAGLARRRRRVSPPGPR